MKNRTILGLLGLLVLTVVGSPPAQADRRISPALALARICVHEASLPLRDTQDVDRDGDTTDWVRHPWQVVDAQDVDSDGNTSELVWVSSDWGNDCWGIHEVLLRGASRHGLSYVSFAQAYARGVFRPRATSRGNVWAAYLTPEGTEPSGWPSTITRRVAVGDRVAIQTRPHMPWAAARSSWLYAWELSQAIARHGLEDVGDWSVCDEPVHHWGSPTLDHHRAVRAGWPTISCGSTANNFYQVVSLVEHEEPLDLEVRD